MLRLARPLGTVLALVVALAVSRAVAAQGLISPGHENDPAAQQAAHREQRAAREAPLQFGTLCCQILQIPASDFHPIDKTQAGYLANGGPGFPYETLVPGTLGVNVWAPVTLPSGVALDYLDLYYYDTDASYDLCVDLVAYSGTTGPSSSVISTTCSEFAGGFGYISNVASGTILNDVAYGGGAQYALIVYTGNPTSALAFKAVDIWWHRQVSPAPAIATFNDVPTNHPFFQFVEALVASGITVGCQVSPPLYCPDAPLTRKQMAAFLAKGLGLYWQY